MMNDGWVYCDRIRPADLPTTVLAYYVGRYRHSDSDTWRRRILNHQVRLDDRPTTPDTELLAGQRLTYHRPPWQEPPVPLELPVLYEDSLVLAVHKPAGLPVLPGGNFLHHTLLWQLRQGCPTAAPIHRLGRGTSGLVLVAKTKAARACLSQQLRQRRLGKIYRALIGSAPQLPENFTITQPIGRVPYPRLGYVYGATPAGLEAHSEGRVLQRRPEATLLDVSITTGRPHQIRIHLASRGYPLVGDPLYGPDGLPNSSGDAIPSDCGYWLHARRVEFQHPNGHALTLDCLPPPPLALG